MYFFCNFVLTMFNLLSKWAFYWWLPLAPPLKLLLRYYINIIFANFCKNRSFAAVLIEYFALKDNRNTYV